MEDQADLETLIAEYYQRFAPATPEERCFVDTLVRAEWQLRRLHEIDAELWEHQLTAIPEEGFPRGRAFQLADAAFARLQRRIDAVERSFVRALHEIERLQAARMSAGPEPLPSPQPVANSPASPQIGFVPHLVAEAASVGHRPASRPSPQESLLQTPRSFRRGASETRAARYNTACTQRISVAHG
jgi:hypothetical protein